VASLFALAAVLSSCAFGSSSAGSAKPADVYSIMPTQDDVRTLMGDNNWWAGPPSFEVLPLNAERMEVSQKFSVSEEYVHLGTGEQMVARYTLFDKSSSATSMMSNLSSTYSGAATSPKVGDDVLYVAQGSTGGAPFRYTTFVRSGQVILQMIWARKDRNLTTSTLAKVAKVFADPIKDLGKDHATLSPVDANLLPPPGLDITMLGAANLPLESFTVLSGVALPDTVLALLRSNGASTFVYGDYALNDDTHMEVQTAILKFPTPTAAVDFATTFAPNPPDDSGIAAGYLKIGGGTPASGVYHFVFSQGVYGVLMICKSSIDGEAASRECEDPSERTAIAWKAGLQGIRS
jgi:hypothetical protein